MRLFNSCITFIVVIVKLTITTVNAANNTYLIGQSPGRNLTGLSYSQWALEQYLIKNNHSNLVGTAKVAPPPKNPPNIVNIKTNGTVQPITKRSNCGFAAAQVGDFDFQVDVVTYQTLPITGGDPYQSVQYLVSVGEGLGPECAQGSIYVPNYGPIQDICNEHLYVGQDPWDTSQWMYASYCDNNNNPGVIWLNYASGEAAAFCMQDDWGTAVDDEYVVWTVSGVMQCDHYPQAAASVMQVNYYYDQGCTSYTGQ